MESLLEDYHNDHISLISVEQMYTCALSGVSEGTLAQREDTLKELEPRPLRPYPQQDAGMEGNNHQSSIPWALSGDFQCYRVWRGCQESRSWAAWRG